MSGARNRRHGHAFEVLSAKELSAALDLDVRTTRSLGANYGADIATVTGYDARGRPATSEPSVLGWSIECKAWGRRVPASWLRQAQEQMAPGLTPVVLWKRPRRPWQEGSAFLYDEDAPRGWSEQTIGEWLKWLLLEQSRQERRGALDELVRISEVAGLYDLPPIGQYP